MSLIEVVSYVALVFFLMIALYACLCFCVAMGIFMNLCVRIYESVHV